MSFLERLNRILISCLLSLVFVQAGLLFYLHNLQDQARHRLVKNTTEADLTCGSDHFADTSYWQIINKDVANFSSCSKGGCASAYVQWNRSQEKDLHVISIKQAPAFDWQNPQVGGVVEVKINKSEKPQILALVSENLLEWDIKFEEGAKLEKVIVATPQMVWLSGLPDGTPIEYLPKDKMCSYPYAWQEAFNPDNEFRSLIKALRVVSGMKESSFQGAYVGEKFVVPMATKERTVASTDSGEEKKVSFKGVIDWGREEGHVVGKTFRFKEQKYALPDGTKQVILNKNNDQAFAIVRGLLKVWQKDEFLKMDTPMTLPRLGFVESIALDEGEQILYVYNDERSGELFSYDIKNKKWQLVREGFKNNFSSLYFDQENQQLVGLVIKASYFSKTIHMDLKGEVQKVTELAEPIAVDRKRWKWSLGQRDQVLGLNLLTVQNPAGTWQKLQ